MPDKEFLESYQLYRNFKIDLPKNANEISMPKINLYCKKCKSLQTFALINKTDMFGKPIVDPPKGVTAAMTNPNVICIDTSIKSKGSVLNFTYTCVACEEFNQHYSVKISEDGTLIQKIGQFPPQDINVDKVLGKMLGEHLKDYRKGLICENHSYGVGAYSYYRRIIENVIDDLLELIPQIIEDKTQREQFIKESEKIDPHNASDKIKNVKDYLPSSLKVQGNNPLKILYRNLSEGIHSLSDEECLNRAINIRVSLVFLVKKINNELKDQKEFAESLKNLQ